MPHALDPATHREALAALAAHLGEEPDLEEVVAAESLLFPGVLMIGGGMAYFLCRRFGAWEVMTEFPTAEIKGVEAVSSFGAQGHEVRLLHRGRLLRFSDLDAEIAARIVTTLKRKGAEGLDERSKARRARAAAANRQAPRSAPTALPTTSWSASALPSRSAGAAAGGEAQGSSFSAFAGAGAAIRGEASDDDDDLPEDDDDLPEDDDDDASAHDDDEADALARFERAAAAAKERAAAAAAASAPTQAKAPAKKGILFPAILVGVVYGVASPIVFAALWETFLHDPEIITLALPAATWALVGLVGGLFGGGLGRGLALAIAGAIAGAMSGAVLRDGMEYVPWASFPALALLGYVYVALRKGPSPLVKGLVAALGALIVFGMFDLRVGGSTTMFGVAIFWAIHYAWARADA